MEERRKSKAKTPASEGRRYKSKKAGLKTGPYIAAKSRRGKSRPLKRGGYSGGRN